MSARLQSLAREPLYQQVCAHLVRQISAGTWKSGTALPNEKDLARQLGVSNGTIRKALARLASERLVSRRQGRGTFVVDQTSPEIAFRFDRLREHDGGRMTLQATVLRQCSGAPTQIEQERLRLDAQEQVARVSRLWRTQGRPLLVEDACLATTRLPGLHLHGLGDWGITAIAQQHGVHLGRAVEKLCLELATDETALILETKSQAVLLRLDRVIFSADDEPIEWRVAIVHPRTIARMGGEQRAIAGSSCCRKGTCLST